jgi:hypothetical protein
MIYLLIGRAGSGKDKFADILVKRGMPETTLFEGGVADMTAKFCRIEPADINIVAKKNPSTAFKIVNIDAEDINRRINFVKDKDDKIRAEMEFDAIDKKEYDAYSEFEDRMRKLSEQNGDSYLPENVVGIYNFVNDEKNPIDSYSEIIIRDNRLHNRIESIIRYLADNGIITKLDENSIVTASGSASIDCFADIAASSDSKLAELMRVYLVAADTVGAIDVVTNETEKSEDETPVTTRREMKNLRNGDTFYVLGQKHTAHGDAHLSGDSSYDGYIVYDERDESWFEEDFPDDDLIT